MAVNDRSALLAQAHDLPTAKRADFVRTPYPSDTEPSTLKVIADLDLRRRLIAARIAEMVQSPKGPLQRPYIIRVYPNFDAPLPSAAAPRPIEAARAFPARPTIEEVAALIERIRTTETEVEARLIGEIDARVTELRGSIGHLEGEELRARIRELSGLLDRRDAVGNAVREEAFRAIEADASFAPRRYLNLFSRER